MSEEINVLETVVDSTPIAQETGIDLANISTLKKGAIVTGKVVKVEQDQAIVDVGYKYDGTIPLRELSNVKLENANDAVQVGQELQLKVVSIDDNKALMTLSKRLVDSEKMWDILQAKLESKETIEAKVSEVVKGGLVVDLGVRGFVPASMVERTFVEDFSAYKGRTLRLRVKEIDREKNKVVLSQKDILDEEFEASKQNVLSTLSVGQIVEGTVQRLTQFGAFVDIGGVDGLVHVSELAWNRVEKPSDIVKEGDQVKVQILKLDLQNKKISLSIKATLAGPWQQVEQQFQVGQIVSGTVKRLATFGAFIEIAPGVEGLVHISQIAHKHIATPHEVLKEGQQVEAKILDIVISEKRISLSIKETEEAPSTTPKPERSGGRREKASEQIDYSANNQSLNLTLGERFGDKLSKFK